MRWGDKFIAGPAPAPPPGLPHSSFHALAADWVNIGSGYKGLGLFSLSFIIWGWFVLYTRPSFLSLRATLEKNMDLFLKCTYKRVQRGSVVKLYKIECWGGLRCDLGRDDGTDETQLSSKFTSIRHKPLLWIRAVNLGTPYAEAEGQSSLSVSLGSTTAT